MTVSRVPPDLRFNVSLIDVIYLIDKRSSTHSHVNGKIAWLKSVRKVDERNVVYLYILECVYVFDNGHEILWTRIEGRSTGFKVFLEVCGVSNSRKSLGGQRIFRNSENSLFEDAPRYRALLVYRTGCFKRSTK